MIQISSFLDKFKRILKSDEDIKRCFISCLAENIAKKISPTNLKYRDCIMNIKCHPLYKGEILMNKEKILEKFNSLNSGVKLVDIR